jgi:HEPN domain-containing protein
MTDREQVVLQWLERAEVDLRAAEILIEADPLILDIACFHCQQAVEKFLKGYLGYIDIVFPFTHSLEYLLELCSEHDNEFGVLEIGNLTQFAVRMRYPHDSFAPDKEESIFYFEVTGRVKKMVQDRLIGLF